MRAEIHRWAHAACPTLTAAVGLWPETVGHLIARGDSRRALCLAQILPHVVVRGRGTFQTVHGTWHLGAGEAFCLWPGVAYVFEEDPADPWEFWWLKVVGEQNIGFAQALGFSERQPVCTVHDLPLAIESLRRLKDVIDRRDREPSMAALELLFRFAVAITGPPGRQPRRSDASLVVEARRLLDETPLTPPNVTGLARSLGVSRTVLGLAFRRTGSTPSELVHAARIARAQRLLADSDEKIAQIAHQCGFRSPTYFYRAFRRATGQTPAAWRATRSP